MGSKIICSLIFRLLGRILSLGRARKFWGKKSRFKEKGVGKDIKLYGTLYIPGRSFLGKYIGLFQVNFWYQEYFHGVNLSTLRASAMTEYFRLGCSQGYIFLKN